MLYLSSEEWNGMKRNSEVPARDETTRNIANKKSNAWAEGELRSEDLKSPSGAS